MAATHILMDQGSTFSWTQSYGSAPLGRTRQLFRDAAFALAVAVLIAGVAGFVGYEKPAAATITQDASFNRL
jgi:hypothetical protein